MGIGDFCYVSVKYLIHNATILSKIPPVKSFKSLSMNAKTPSPSNVKQIIVNLFAMDLSISDNTGDHTGIKNELHNIPG